MLTAAVAFLVLWAVAGRRVASSPAVHPGVSPSPGYAGLVAWLAAAGVAVVLLACGAVLYWRRKYRYLPRQRSSVRQSSAHLERPGQGPRFFPPAMRTYILRRDRYCCTNCGSRDALEIDHVVPYSLGGCTVPSNGKTLCSECNQLKSNRFSELGMLSE